MSNVFNFEKATRAGVKPLIGLYGESNSGKTFSALLLARGLAGPDGMIALVDSESGRGALYANEIPGGYNRADFEPPFSPMAFVDALTAAEESGAKVVVFDSFSQEWSGEGGVLDMAGENEAAGKKGLAVWKNPKMEHAKLILRLMRAKTFVIVCLRAKFKSRQVKNNGRTEIVKDDHVSPIQDDELLFEMTCHCEMQSSNPGTIRLTKWSVPDLAECFPKDGAEKLSIAHGEAIAKWATAGGHSAKPQQQARNVPVGDPLKAAKRDLWNVVKANFDDVAAFETYLLGESLLGEGETLADLPVERLNAIKERMVA